MSHFLDHQEAVSQLGVKNPFAQFILSICFLLLGNSIPEVGSEIHSMADLHIPKIILETGQMIAWCSAGGLFCIGLLRFIVEMKDKREKRLKESKGEKIE